MNCVQAIQDYINKMVSNIPGMKVLLLDKETMGIVSIVFSQSQILQKEVYLFERLDVKAREKMAHLKAVCFIRPTMNNIKDLCAELRDPKYGEYHLFFSNTLKKNDIDDLAEADEQEIVQELQEFFADYFAVNTDLFTLNLEQVISVQQPNWNFVLDRIVDGISSSLLSLKKQPYIRFSKKSDMANKVVQELQRRMSEERDLFAFRKSDTPPLLFIMDRKDDPVTPLLTQWTYQAMVHDLLGIKNNRVDLSKVPGITKDMAEIVLSSEQDNWYKENMFLNFGDLGVNVKNLVDDFQLKSKSNQSITSIEDMKKFVENYPEFRKLQGSVTKHVTLMSELSRVVDSKCLLDVSEVEQELANRQDHAAHLKSVKNLFQNAKIQSNDLLKVVLLYTLRYETLNANEIRTLTDMLTQTGMDSKKVQLVDTLLQYAGANVRGTDIFANMSILSNLRRKVAKGLKGVSNIYTEHVPFLNELLSLIVTNKLRPEDYPFFTGQPTKDPPQDIIVFIIGGVTYEESLAVNNFNKARPGVRVILGGTTIHNSTSFLEDLSLLNTMSYR